MQHRELSFCVRVVLYREEEMWIAHCLEFDVIGSGETQSKAVSDLTTAMQIQIEQSIKHNNVRNLFRPADSGVYAMFAAGLSA